MDIPAAIAAVAPDGQLTPAQRRRILIDICRRRIRPGTGSSLEFLQRRTAINPWVVIGAVATRAYMPERATGALDILVRREDGDEVRERLEAAGYTFVTDLAVPGFLFHSPEGVEVDVVLGDDPWLDEALAHPRQDPAGFPVLDLPYLVLMKMGSFRSLDLGDLTRMLGLASDEELAAVRAVVARYAPTETDDLESLIYLGCFEIRTAMKVPNRGAVASE
jgi:hypothetical protein